MLDHLIENGLRQTPAEGLVTLAAERGGGEVRLIVSDTGRGIPFHVQAHIFDRFVGRDQGGPGLGLALVKALVELHGGWVALESEPGAGATFTCHLPESRPRDRFGAGAVLALPDPAHPGEGRDPGREKLRGSQPRQPIARRRHPQDLTRRTRSRRGVRRETETLRVLCVTSAFSALNLLPAAERRCLLNRRPVLPGSRPSSG